jgi:uncharacterized protein YdhG (YjbR/CyaY superfamily)
MAATASGASKRQARPSAASARPRPRTIGDYIAGFPPETQAVLERVRGVIRKALPKAEEGISYGIPVFKQHGGYVIYFAGWKEHYSLYPANTRLEAAFAERLAPYELSGRGTIRFPLAGAVPVKLISDIAKYRVKEAAEHARAKAAAKKR